ncbi:MAG: tRNA guanosine(34) transglycosylase Tgt [Pseudomonadota bacterium]|nr:tRNA guanosine(34) transglycosylase Tgt [Pseudomonadota bacterium]
MSEKSVFCFDQLSKDRGARRGRVTTAHGTFETPCFMATATAATVKAMPFEAVRAAGAELVICNTYHLMLRPGSERIAALGGLHSFMGWQGPLLTDSGGYQVMSLSALRDISEQGVVFRSHLDGSKHELTPERSIKIQFDLDSNITMCFDECTPHPATHEQASLSMRMSMRWAKRCKEAFEPRTGYALFGINQGSMFEDLRRESADALQQIGFDGYSIGGLSVGEGQDEMFRILEATVPHLPEDKPRYLMGVGWPDDIVGAVRRGIDMFDCVIPTRSGRTGQAITRRGTVNMRNARHQADDRPIDENCLCVACRNHSRAYIHHLFRAGEMLGPMLLTGHNLHYYQDLMRGLRQAIDEARLDAFAKDFAEAQAQGDIEERT